MEEGNQTGTRKRANEEHWPKVCKIIFPCLSPPPPLLFPSLDI
uniref:Phf21a protein n=1 Tax=Mus musculus TaxID=10090 RepID=Q08EN1_MOUSE|nr:Phf21a protein [Mus musculus]